MKSKTVKMISAVIALGVPTVVDAATIANDTLELMIGKLKEEKSEIADAIEKMENDNKYSYITEVLSPEELNYIVTPSAIDEIITNVSKVLASGINTALNG